MNDETKDLAARMAADEANEGNYAAAAELQKVAAAVSGPPGDPTGHDARCAIRFGFGPCNCSLAPTGPLTPGQVVCRVCRLDDRTRAASSPDDGLCDVCREDEPNRIQKLRRAALKRIATTLYGLAEDDPIHDDETAAGSAERDLRRERVDTLMRLADLIDGHPLPYSLVNRAELAAGTRYVVAAQGTRILHTWDGELFDRAEDPRVLRDLAEAQERAKFDNSPWRIFALVPVVGPVAEDPR